MNPLTQKETLGRFRTRENRKNSMTRLEHCNSAGEVHFDTPLTSMELPQPQNNVINKGRWSKREKKIFEEAFKQYGKEWKLIASLIKTRTVIQIRTHAQKYFQKIAKQTGGPVMSTSKKEKFHNPSLSTFSLAKKQNTMNLRKRSTRRLPKVDSQRKIKRRRTSLTLSNRERNESFETLVGSGDDSDFNPDDYISKQVKNFASKEISAEVVAAATLLLAPRHNKTISSDTLTWARNHVLRKL